MRRAPIPEAIHIVLSTRTIRINWGIVLAHLLRQQVGVVDTLGAGQDFLAAHEHVVGVGEEGVLGRGHGVGGADGEGKLVQDVEVRVVFLQDEFAEFLFLGGAIRSTLASGWEMKGDGWGRGRT